MFGMLSALPAKLGKLEFLRSIQLAPLRDVVLTFANSADKCDDDSLFLLGHSVLLYPTSGSFLKELVVGHGVNDNFCKKLPSGVRVMDVVSWIHIELPTVSVTIKARMIGVGER